MAGELPSDPNTLQARLHQYIRQQEITSSTVKNKQLTIKKSIYCTEDKRKDENEDFEVLCNSKRQPIL